ncbi:sensor histidine kinase [Paenibacillus nasutitermitis]|uniref:histidine kinase n=1 Tax=Paenibacillus nasutitermitis TaxID=1652958 RepID=A0A916YV19_9BACL|nr:HAMP domain-containing sensor histidine kinase [Paenibacillus nasutitermitis]GGD62471.1 two-component sensor histidine kinase [Paenibacillus nasutitermitis]
MSIRKKLLLSYIAMIVVPIIVFGLTAALVVSMFFNNQTGIAPLNKFFGEFKNVKEFRDKMDKRSEWASAITFFAGHEPERLADSAFLVEAEQELSSLNIRLVIERDGQLSYISPAIAGIGDQITDKLTPFRSDKSQGFHNNQLKLNGNAYTVLKKDFQFADHSGGIVYILEEDWFSSIGRIFFITIFLFVVLVIGLTNGLLTYFVSRGIVRPLYKLKQAAEQIKDGNLDNELKLVRKDEIGQLSAAFEEMRIRLRASIYAQLQAEENRKELLSNISHDLKTPITAISACAEGMRDGIVDTPEKQSKYIDMIYSKAAHMDNLIDELFLYSKLDLKRLPFHFEQTDMNAYLQAFAEELQLHPQYKGIRIVYDHAPGRSVAVMADREKLGRVIANIAGNSMKHMDKSEKEIRIELNENRQDEEVTVKIIDNGRGIDEAGLPHIFDRFYRTDSSRNTDTGGSGLGLAIVKQIIEAHGGRVWAQSVPGEGTAILFTLKTPEGYKGESHEKNTGH